VRIISDNRRYEQMDLPAERVKINGKVTWFGKEIETEGAAFVA